MLTPQNPTLFLRLIEVSNDLLCVNKFLLQKILSPVAGQFCFIDGAWQKFKVNSATLGCWVYYRSEDICLWCVFNGVEEEWCCTKASVPSCIYIGCSVLCKDCSCFFYGLFRFMYRLFRFMYRLFRFMHRLFRFMYRLLLFMYRLFQFTYRLFRFTYRLFRFMYSLFRFMYSLFRFTYKLFRFTYWLLMNMVFRFTYWLFRFTY